MQMGFRLPNEAAESSLSVAERIERAIALFPMPFGDIIDTGRDLAVPRSCRIGVGCWGVCDHVLVVNLDEPAKIF